MSVVALYSIVVFVCLLVDCVEISGYAQIGEREKRDLINGNAPIEKTHKTGNFPWAERKDNNGLTSSSNVISILKKQWENNLTPQVTTSNETECIAVLEKECINKFRHIVYYSEANFVYLNLVPMAGVNIVGSRYIVGENVWVWTFYGKEGGLEMLTWPIEFGIWSMGLLSSYVINNPMTMELSRVSGNCSNLKVGEQRSDKVISNALVNLTIEMMKFGEKYGPSFFCYKSRLYIEPHFVYMLCKHIVCPIEAMKYNCCSYFYNSSLQMRKIGCREHEFKYDPINWILPTIVSVLLFGLCPIFILYIGHVVADEGKGHLKGILRSFAQNIRSENNTPTEGLVLLDEHHHVTLIKTLCLPFKYCWCNVYSSASKSIQIILRRCWRMFLPFLSLIIIALQVFLDHYYLQSFVKTSIQKGVPMGFRSVLAGYAESKQNFLPFLGGPFVAVGVYLLLTCILLVIPKSVSEMLLRGLQGNSVDETSSPLCLRLRSIEMFGSVSIRRRHGFYKIYSVLLAQLFMLINCKFWKHVIIVQYDRCKKCFFSKIYIPLIPFYFVFCAIEITLCAALYGYPVISFGVIIIKAYCGELWNRNLWRRLPMRIVACSLTIVLIVSVMYFLFMFCTIFMDACLFFTRVVVFTFTGIVVFPKVSYGYLIFTFTVIYYIWQSIQEYSLVYQRLLKDTVATCEDLQRGNDRERLVIKRGDYKAIKESLFEHVIEKHCPRRKQVFLSALKVGVILTILGLSVNILVETDGFRELHAIMHVGTALFVCALPQIVKSMCRGHGEKFKQKRFRKELADTIINYIGYDATESTGSDSLYD